MNSPLQANGPGRTPWRHRGRAGHPDLSDRADRGPGLRPRPAADQRSRREPHRPSRSCGSRSPMAPTNGRMNPSAMPSTSSADRRPTASRANGTSTMPSRRTSPVPAGRPGRTASSRDRQDPGVLREPAERACPLLPLAHPPRVTARACRVHGVDRSTTRWRVAAGVTAARRGNRSGFGSRRGRGRSLRGIAGAGRRARTPVPRDGPPPLATTA